MSHLEQSACGAAARSARPRARRRSVVRARWLLLLTLLLASWREARAEDKPDVIRIANPGVGIGNRPVVGGSAWSLVHLRGMLEDEFAPDGIKVSWTFLRGAGPAVNELYANQLTDFSAYGDLPSIIGRASGLDTRRLRAVFTPRSGPGARDLHHEGRRPLQLQWDTDGLR